MIEEKTLLHRFPQTGFTAPSLPRLNLAKVKDALNNFLHFVEATKDSFATSISSGVSRINLPSPNFSGKKTLRIVLYVAIAFALLLGGYRLYQAFKTSSSDSGKVSVKGASASQEINREFTFPLRDSSGEEVSQLKYMIEKAELRDEIIVKGQRANSVRGRTFLIVNLKISNEFNKPININTRDYIRLSVNGDEAEWLAPDVHNDPVEVQAISTKYTRVGFPINTVDTKLILRVGEIDGEKQLIELSFN